jgi:two-component system, OmpR family, sensor kinase
MNNFKTLYAKLSIGLVLLLLTIGLLYTFISGMAAQNYIQQLSQELHRNLARNLVADRNLVEEGKLNQAALKETFRQYMVVNPSIEIYLLDLKGKIIAYSADPGKVKRHKVSLKPIYAFLDQREHYPLGDDPRSHDRSKAFSVTSVPSAEKPEGYLYVVLRGEEYDRVDRMAQESYFLRVSGWAVTASLITGLIVGLIVFYLLTRRLRRLANEMDCFDQSDFKADIINHYCSPHRDEIDQIGSMFERMARRIREQIEQLTEKDSQRRQLVAQVSHDLRTPLASMLGYLESLELKGEKLSEQERKQFLETAMRQGRRLTHLIESLFELSSLEANEKKPHCEPFMPAELIYDVAYKHRLKAEKLNISLQLHIECPELFAMGDISLMERVIDNLIDNAFSHSGKNAKIEITLLPSIQDNKWVALSVKDYGTGIDSHLLPALFEPFVQGKAANSYAHAGLGLAISKRMMELQAGLISVESKLGKGCTFTLYLPKA